MDTHHCIALTRQYNGSDKHNLAHPRNRCHKFVVWGINIHALSYVRVHTHTRARAFSKYLKESTLPGLSSTHPTIRLNEIIKEDGRWCASASTSTCTSVLASPLPPVLLCLGPNEIFLQPIMDRGILLESFSTLGTCIFNELLRPQAYTSIRKREKTILTRPSTLSWPSSLSGNCSTFPTTNKRLLFPSTKIGI